MFEWENRIKDKYTALTFLQALAEKAKPDRKTFHVYGSFGDVYLQLSVLTELLRDGESINIIIDKNYQKLTDLALSKWPAQANVLLAPGSVVNQMLTNIDLLGKSKNFPIRLLSTLYPMVPNCIYDGVLQYVDFTRLLAGSSCKGKLSPLECHERNINEAEEIIIESGGKIGSSMIICPHNNTHEEFTAEFWLNIIEFVKNAGWTPLINSGGALRSNVISDLASYGFKTINIPPHLVVTVTATAGSYTTGVNGYSTIQALFNYRTVGFNLINNNCCTEGRIIDKALEGANPQIMSHSYSFREQDLGLQRDIMIADQDNFEIFTNQFLSQVAYSAKQSHF